MFLASYAFIQGRASLGRKRGGELEDITLLPTPAAKQGKWLKTEGPKVYKCTVSFSTCIAFLHTQCMLEQCFQMCQLSPHYWYVSKVPARAPAIIRCPQLLCTINCDTFVWGHDIMFISVCTCVHTLSACMSPCVCISIWSICNLQVQHISEPSMLAPRHLFGWIACTKLPIW